VKPAIQDTTGRDLKYQIVYRSKKNTYGIPNTYRTGFYVAEILFKSFCTKVLRGTVYREQYYTVQYSAVLPKKPTGRK
jgi:hypothetical protein